MIKIIASANRWGRSRFVEDLVSFILLVGIIICLFSFPTYL